MFFGLKTNHNVQQKEAFLCVMRGKYVNFYHIKGHESLITLSPVHKPRFNTISRIIDLLPLVLR